MIKLFGPDYARIYDKVMETVPYDSWIEYLETIIYKIGRQNICSILDLACGTGRLAIKLAKRGYFVFGVDQSKYMIEEANKKNPPANCRFFCQQLSQLNLPQTFDLALCLYDGLNYIIDHKKLQKSFAHIRDHLKSNGLFIFDMNTEYAYKMDFFSQSRNEETSLVKYIWDAFYDDKDKICQINLNFKVFRNQKWHSFQEIHLQKAYKTDEIIRMLKSSSFELLFIYEAFTFNRPNKASERIYYVTKKA